LAYIALICLFNCYMMYIHNINFSCIVYLDLTFCSLLLSMKLIFSAWTFFCNMVFLCFCWIFVRDRLTHKCFCKCETVCVAVFYVVFVIAWLRCYYCGALMCCLLPVFICCLQEDIPYFFHVYYVFVMLLAKTCSCVLYNQYFLDFFSECRVCFCVVIYCNLLNTRLLGEKFRFECLMECACIVCSWVFLFQPI
jgi:hypothetical protein